MPIPKLRFKDENGQNYPEWETSKLSNYLVVNPDRNAKLCFTKNDVYSVSGELGVVNQISLLGRSFAGASVAPYHIVYTNDVIYTKSPLKAAPYGIIKTNKGKAGIVSTLYAVYHPKKNTNPQFIEYYFGNDHRQNKYLKPLVNIGSKHDMKISNEAVLGGTVCFPSLTEQTKVADFLTSYDRMIDVQSQRVEAMKTRKNGLLQKIFSQEIRFKDDQGQEYPEWILKSLKDIASVYDGVHQTPNYQKEGIPFVSVENIRDLDKTNKYISLKDYQKNYKVYPQKGDILMTRIGDIGTSAIVRHEPLAYYVSLALIKVKSNVSSDWLNQYIGSTDFQYELFKRSLQFAFPKKINKNEIDKCKLMVPSLPEQQKIADFLTAVDTQIDVEEKRLETMKTIKKGLLQQMFI